MVADIRIPRRKNYRTPEPWTPNGHCRGCSKPLTGRQRSWCEPLGECARRFFAQHGQGAFRSYVLKRDNYTCQLCGVSRARAGMEADHIVPISEGGAEFDPDNGRTLCHDCHVGETAKLRRRLANKLMEARGKKQRIMAQGKYVAPWPGLEDGHGSNRETR